MRELVKSPIAGKLYEYWVKEGEEFEQGDILVVVESMKMLNEIAAEKSGKVTKLFHDEKTNVSYDQELLEIEV